MDLRELRVILAPSLPEHALFPPRRGRRGTISPLLDKQWDFDRTCATPITAAKPFIQNLYDRLFPLVIAPYRSGLDGASCSDALSPTVPIRCACSHFVSCEVLLTREYAQKSLQAGALSLRHDHLYGGHSISSSSVVRLWRWGDMGIFVNCTRLFFSMTRIVSPHHHHHSD